MSDMLDIIRKALNKAREDHETLVTMIMTCTDNTWEFYDERDEMSVDDLKAHAVALGILPLDDDGKPFRLPPGVYRGGI